MSPTELQLHPDRLFASDAQQRAIARRLYHSVQALPIISPHGHTDPQWFADDAPFSDAASLLLIPDHYLFRMLYSQGITLDALGIPRSDGTVVQTDRRAIWALFAQHYHLFLGTPSRLWLDHVLHTVFGFTPQLSAHPADSFFDQIGEALQTAAFRPRALLDRFGIELIATTEGATDRLPHHARLQGTPWAKRVITTFRPDDVVDASRDDFALNLVQLGVLTGHDTGAWDGYLAALRNRRAFFRTHGAVATDHGHPTARTAALPRRACEQLFMRVRHGAADAADCELFRAQMLTEMARMSIDDGMVMQLHPGSYRNHNAAVFARFGRDKGADIPQPTDYVSALKPLLDQFGNDTRLSLILFTLDESAYSRELAPLAGHYPALRLGPPWWFHDSVEGMLRFRQQVSESAGFYNTAGFNDDTRAFLSIPARHDVARRMDCRYLATLVAEHRLTEDEAHELAQVLTVDLVRSAYRLAAGSHAGAMR